MKIRAFIFISTIFFISCGKELSKEIATNPPPPPIPAVGKLAKLIYLDTSQSHPRDTGLIQYFSYDANQRINKVTSWQYSSGVLRENEIVDYYFIGSDTLASHAKYTYYYRSTPADTAIADFYFTYNSNKQLIKDSMFDTHLAAYSNNTQISYLVNDYNNQPNGFLQDRTYYNTNSIPNTYKSSVTCKEVNNGINVVSRITEDVTNNQKWDVQFFYDTTVNAVYKSRPVNDRLTGGNSSPLQFVPDNTEPARNNITKIITKTYELSSGTLLSATTRDLSYEYNTAGQPVVMRVKTNDPVHLALYNKYIFIYQ
jgi:hypothetical protein